MTNKNEVTIFSTPDDLFAFAANDFTKRAMAAVREKGIFSVVLSGGNTPKSFFDVLVNNDYCRKNTPWPYIQFFFGDERYVPATDPESNYHLAYVNLFSKVPINLKNIYRIPTEFDDPNKAANEYDLTLRQLFNLRENECPSFDLIYLGLGNDGHTASLMPLSDIVMDASDPLIPMTHPLVTAVYVSKQNRYRITLTPPIINHAKEIIFLVTHSDKATAVWEVLKGKYNPQYYPAQLIHCELGKTLWYLDESAARKLDFLKM